MAVDVLLARLHGLPIAQLGTAGTKDTLMLAFVVVGVLAVILLIVVIALWLRLRKQKKTAGTATDTGQADIGNDESGKEETRQGYLENLDDAAQHAILNNPFRIGRHSSNHLPIIDRSVSRQHAEIHRDNSGRYAITDMDSMNGVFVNNRQLKRSALSDGDLVELGDISFTFKLSDTPPPAPLDQATVMLDRSEPKLFIDDEPLDFEPDIFDNFDDDLDDLDDLKDIDERER